MSENKSVSIPRIIFADERSEALIPPSVIMASALQRRGYRIKPFVVGIDEYLVALLYLLLGEPVTVLDPFLVKNPTHLAELFAAASYENGLNVLFASLGKAEDEDIAVNPDLLVIGEQLQCPIIPIFTSKGSSAFTARRIIKFSRDLSNPIHELVAAIAFTSVPNPREYQLLEISIGRDLPWTTLGYIPSFILKEKPKLISLIDRSSSSQCLLPIKTSAARLIAMERQVEWEVIVAHARSAPPFGVKVLEHDAYNQSCRIGVIHHPALVLGGDNNEKFFEAHRFNVIPLDFKDKIAYNDVNFIYVPHGMGYMFMVDLIDNVSLMEALAASRFKGKLFVEGGASPIFGEVFHLPNESTIKGLSFFPYEGRYKEFSSTCHKVHVENISSESSEKAFRGYWPSWVLLELKGFDCISTWIAKKVGSQTSAEDGWRVDNAVASSLKLEFWSNPEAIDELLN